MADQNTAVKISLLFKDTSNDNYFTKYSSHILATIIILFIIIGLITYYKIKSELGSYKYRKDIKTGKLLWPTEKCKPHILPIAGHISRSPGETADEATFRNFEECVESMVKDKNNEYINPFNEIVAAALAMSGTVMAGFGFVLNSVIGLADYIKNQFGGLGNILARMQNEIKSILEKEIYIKLGESYDRVYQSAWKHIAYLKTIIDALIASARIEFFKLSLYYIYFTILSKAYEIGSGLNWMNKKLFGGSTATETGTGYYYRIYSKAAKELSDKLGVQQAFFTGFGTDIGPNIVGDDADTVKLMDQNYTLFSSSVYSDGWHDYSDTQNIEFIQPMCIADFNKYFHGVRGGLVGGKEYEWSIGRKKRFDNVTDQMDAHIALWNVPAVEDHGGEPNSAMGPKQFSPFFYKDFYFTEDWRKPHPDWPQVYSLKWIFEERYKMGAEKGAVMSPGSKAERSLSYERIYLPMESDHPGQFKGTYNQLKTIPGPNGEAGYYAERRDMTLGLIKQQYTNALEAKKEIERMKNPDTGVWSYYKLMNKCITITYVDKDVPKRVSERLRQLRGGDNSDKSNQWIDVDVENRKIHISKVEWDGVEPPRAPESWEIMDVDRFTTPSSFFRGVDPWLNAKGNKGTTDNPFKNDPIWWSEVGAAGTYGERTAFLFDRSKNKIEVKLPDKKMGDEKPRGYHSGQVRFKLQRYDFTTFWFGGKKVAIEKDTNGDLMVYDKKGRAVNGRVAYEKKCPEAPGWAFADGMVAASANSPFCRVFGRTTIGTGYSGTAEMADADSEKSHHNQPGAFDDIGKHKNIFKKQRILHPGVGELDLDVLPPSDFTFDRKNARGLTAWEMEDADYALVTDSTTGMDASIVKVISDIVLELRWGQGGGAHKKTTFQAFPSAPAISPRVGGKHPGKKYVGKACITTGGDGTRNSEDNSGRKPELDKLAEVRDSFGMVRKEAEGDKPWGGGDASESTEWKMGKEVEFLKKGWATGVPVFPTVWSKQSEKKEAGATQPQLFDVGGTNVCEPGWEFNIGPYEQTKKVKIENRHKTHPCVMKNLTLYSKLQFCFGIDSPIFLSDGKKINIQDVQLGDILADGSVVTSSAISEIGENIVYMMPSSDQPILVSNQHKVELITFDENGLRQKQFIKSEEHPDAIKYDDYKHDLLYCISTNTSRIVINDYVFQDWNEIGVLDYYELFNFFNQSTYFKHLNKFGIFLDDAVREMIHTQLASGLWGKTPIRLYDKSVCNLDEVKIGDFLTSGEKILSIIKTKCDDVTIYKHKIQGKTFYGSKNISYYPKHQETPVAINLLMDPGSIKQDALPDGDKVLYHFITNSGVVSINGVDIAYHNHALQHILSI
uniref:Hint domain-containing protein n=1 Tax=viral metagenome TaxID=1070528 RepID=A0A6C0BVY5_9ZZZZ